MFSGASRGLRPPRPPTRALSLTCWWPLAAPKPLSEKCRHAKAPPFLHLLFGNSLLLQILLKALICADFKYNLLTYMKFSMTGPFNTGEYTWFPVKSANVKIASKWKSNWPHISNWIKNYVLIWINVFG